MVSPAVIPALVAGSHRAASSGACGRLDPGDKARDDSHPSFTPQAAAQLRPSTVPRRGLYSQPTQPL